MGLTEGSEEELEWAEKIRRKKSQLHFAWKEAEHPGCEISGHLLVDRVPVSSEETTAELDTGYYFLNLNLLSRETFTFKPARLITI